MSETPDSISTENVDQGILVSPLEDASPSDASTGQPAKQQAEQQGPAADSTDAQQAPQPPQTALISTRAEAPERISILKTNLQRLIDLGETMISVDPLHETVHEAPDENRRSISLPMLIGIFANSLLSEQDKEDLATRYIQRIATNGSLEDFPHIGFVAMRPRNPTLALILNAFKLEASKRREKLTWEHFSGQRQITKIMLTEMMADPKKPLIVSRHVSGTDRDRNILDVLLDTDPETISTNHDLAEREHLAKIAIALWVSRNPASKNEIVKFLIRRNRANHTDQATTELIQRLIGILTSNPGFFEEEQARIITAKPENSRESNTSTIKRRVLLSALLVLGGGGLTATAAYIVFPRTFIDNILSRAGIKDPLVAIDPEDDISQPTQHLPQPNLPDTIPSFPLQTEPPIPAPDTQELPAPKPLTAQVPDVSAAAPANPAPSERKWNRMIENLQRGTIGHVKRATGKHGKVTKPSRTDKKHHKKIPSKKRSHAKPRRR